MTSLTTDTHFPGHFSKTQTDSDFSPIRQRLITIGLLTLGVAIGVTLSISTVALAA